MTEMASLRSLTLALSSSPLAYAALALLVTNSYYQLMLTLVLVWAMLRPVAGTSLSGYTGLVSFGHAAFFGIGAYTTALGQIHFDLSPWLRSRSPPCSARSQALADRLSRPSACAAHYFALAMLAYPLALLYVFEWLGYQELTLPMKRETAGCLHAVRRSPHLHAASRWLLLGIVAR